MTTSTPAAIVADQVASPQLPSGDGERFTGSGVMGLAFDSGHYLALRDMAATSIGPAYRALWHRDSDGAWTIFTTTDPELSCPRYFGAACTTVERVDAITTDWADDYALHIRMGQRLDWQVELAATPATRMMSGMGRAMPASAWRSNTMMRSMGPIARPFLRTGRIRLRGKAPSGHPFRAAPLVVWRVITSTAVLDGVDFGRPGPLDQQSHLGDFWMPQRGIFFIANAEFEPRNVASKPTNHTETQS